MELVAVSLQGYHPTGSLGTAWPRTVELNWLLQSWEFTKAKIAKQSIVLWEEVTRDVLCLAWCLSIFGSCWTSVPIPVCGPHLAHFLFMHRHMRDTGKGEPFMVMQE